MVNNPTSHSTKENIPADDQINIVELLVSLWIYRKRIMYIVVVFFGLGILTALISPVQYKASTLIVPQIGESGTKLGGLSNIAAIAGFNLDLNSGSELSPAIYPKIISSIPFKMELMNSRIYLSKEDTTLSVQEYYAKVYAESFINKLKKYTIGSPRLLIRGLQGDHNNPTLNSGNLITITQDEKKVLDFISDFLEIDINEDDGYITLSFRMPEALAAAELTEKVKDLLQKYITAFRIEKANDELKFIQERYLEKQTEFNKAQKALAIFRDQNKNVNTALAKTEEERLQSEYQLTYNVYAELAKQLENAKIKVKENTPVFTVIEPVTVPVKKFKPKRSLILVSWTFVGIIIGISVVIGKLMLIRFHKDWNRNINDSTVV